MPETRLNIRVDGDIKKKAEEIFHDMGLTLSAGVNLYLYRVAAERAIPFPLVQISPGSNTESGQKKKSTDSKAKASVKNIIYQRR